MPNYLIFAFSGVLFLYWMRYYCLVILKAEHSGYHAGQVARANNLSFPDVQDRLRMEPDGAQLEELNQALLHDYRILTCLLRYTPVFEPGGHLFQQRVLMIDFRVMQLWYLLTRKIAPSLARYALDESAQIVIHFAQTMGERTTLSRA